MSYTKADTEENTEGRWPCDEGDRDWRYVATNQGTPGTASNHQKLRDSLNPQERINPTDTLALDSGLLNCERVNFCFLKLPKFGTL